MASQEIPLPEFCMSVSPNHHAAHYISSLYSIPNYIKRRLQITPEAPHYIDT